MHRPKEPLCSSVACLWPSQDWLLCPYHAALSQVQLLLTLRLQSFNVFYCTMDQEAGKHTAVLQRLFGVYPKVLTMLSF